MGMLSKLTGGSADIRGNLESAKKRERDRLAKIKDRDESFVDRFFKTEGQGLRRQNILSFGNEDDLDEMDEDERSLRATGRFAENRLVL